MVLESLFPAKKIYSKPIDMLVLSIIISFICIFLANWIFPGFSTGAIIPLFVTIAMTPLICRIFRMEETVERREAEHKIHKTFWDRHDETIKIFTYFFIGNFISIFLVAVFFPETFVTKVFENQIKTIEELTSISGFVSLPNTLNVIVLNNLKVMILAFLLSFLIGAGALIILSWNASVLALYIAHFVRLGLFSDLFSKTAGILPHAPIEILAYFLAGIAGGILSVGVIREKLRSREFLLVFKDALIMLVISVIAVGFGALIEVFI